MPSAPASAPASSARCDDQAARFGVGRILDAKLTDQLRSRSGAQRVRVVRPGEMVTMEFDEGRLTIEIDAGGRVRKLRCG